MQVVNAECASVTIERILLFNFFQAWRTNAAGEVRSAVSLVSVVIEVLDINDNPPTLANTIPATITLREVSQYQW